MIHKLVKSVKSACVRCSLWASALEASAEIAFLRTRDASESRITFRVEVSIGLAISSPRIYLLLNLLCDLVLIDEEVVSEKFRFLSPHHR